MDIKKVIDVDRTEDVRCEGRFTSMMLAQSSVDALSRAGFAVPSPVQMRAIPVGLLGFDLLVQAKSGTGKTLVFAVLALENLNAQMKAPQVMIVAPTREIATQICSVIRRIAPPVITVCSFVGGERSVKENVQAIHKGVHIVVGTTGRLCHLVSTDCLPTDRIRFFVLDEADKLMDENFQKDVNYLFSSLPTEKQVAVFSATYPHNLETVLATYMRDVYWVRLDASDVQLLGIKQYLLIRYVEPATSSLVKLLKSITFTQCLVFTNDQARCEKVCDFLKSSGVDAELIFGSMEQADRSRVMKRLKCNSVRVLVSTDLTARGIDAENVNMVVNIGCPADAETYLHRIGRAGRFGAYGASFTILDSKKEVRRFTQINESAKFSVRMLHLDEELPVDLCVNKSFFESAQPFKFQKKEVKWRKASIGEEDVGPFLDDPCSSSAYANVRKESDHKKGSDELDNLTQNKSKSTESVSSGEEDRGERRQRYSRDELLRLRDTRSAEQWRTYAHTFLHTSASVKQSAFSSIDRSEVLSPEVPKTKSSFAEKMLSKGKRQRGLCDEGNLLNKHEIATEVKGISQDHVSGALQNGAMASALTLEEVKTEHANGEFERETPKDGENAKKEAAKAERKSGAEDQEEKGDVCKEVDASGAQRPSGSNSRAVLPTPQPVGFSEMSEPKKGPAEKFKFTRSRKSRKCYLRREMLRIREVVTAKLRPGYFERRFGDAVSSELIISSPEGIDREECKIVKMAEEKESTTRTLGGDRLRYSRDEMTGLRDSRIAQEWEEWAKARWNTAEDPFQMDRELRVSFPTQLRILREREKAKRIAQQTCRREEEALKAEKVLIASGRQPATVVLPYSLTAYERHLANEIPRCVPQTSGGMRVGPVVEPRRSPALYYKTIRNMSSRLANLKAQFLAKCALSSGAKQDHEAQLYFADLSPSVEEAVQTEAEHITKCEFEEEDGNGSVEEENEGVYEEAWGSDQWEGDSGSGDVEDEDFEDEDFEDEDFEDEDEYFDGIEEDEEGEEEDVSPSENIAEVAEEAESQFDDAVDEAPLRHPGDRVALEDFTLRQICDIYIETMFANLRD